EGEKRTEMFAFFRAAFRRKTLAEWRPELEQLEICFGPVNTLEEAFADPQVQHRRMILETETATGRSLTIGSPLKLGATADPPHPAPRARRTHRRRPHAPRFRRARDREPARRQGRLMRPETSSRVEASV